MIMEIVGLIFISIISCTVVLAIGIVCVRKDIEEIKEMINNKFNKI